MFGENDITRNYVGFVSSLLNIVYETKIGSNQSKLKYVDIKALAYPDPKSEYKIISLNYDRIIEDSISFINTHFESNISFSIAKLHGSVEGSIVPPTWNKSIGGTNNDAWVNAASWLSNANEIRILGYSLPQSDIYIKHLLSTAFVESNNLQKIDVICLDNDGTLEQRYKNIFSFPKFDFFNRNLNQYISTFSNVGHSNTPFKTQESNAEYCHQQFCEGNLF